MEQTKLELRKRRVTVDQRGHSVWIATVTLPALSLATGLAPAAAPQTEVLATLPDTSDLALAEEPETADPYDRVGARYR